MNKEELLKGLSTEQIAKIKACKSSDEMLKVAKEEGVELSEEQLAAVSGGNICSNCVEEPEESSKDNDTNHGPINNPF